MLIGIISDTHDNLPAIRKAVDIFNRKNVEIVLHAGDYVSPFTAKEFEKLKMKFTGVFGNNDGDKPYLLERFKNIGEIRQDPIELEIGGEKIVLMHQPKFIDELLNSGSYDIIIYGHTHEIDIRKNKSVIINPGECSGWLTDKCTIAVVDTEKMIPEIIQL